MGNYCKKYPDVKKSGRSPLNTLLYCLRVKPWSLLMLFIYIMRLVYWYPTFLFLKNKKDLKKSFLCFVGWTRGSSHPYRRGGRGRVWCSQVEYMYHKPVSSLKGELNEILTHTRNVTLNVQLHTFRVCTEYCCFMYWLQCKHVKDHKWMLVTPNSMKNPDIFCHGTGRFTNQIKKIAQLNMQQGVYMRNGLVPCPWN